MTKKHDTAALDADRLLAAYAQALRRYLDAERALVASSAPVPAEMVYAHDEAAEHFQTIRGMFRASVKRSEALYAVEGKDATT